MLFYDRLIAETESERTEFTSIPLIREALRSGASRELYLRLPDASLSSREAYVPAAGFRRGENQR